MVFYFTSRCGKYTMYMGKHKEENEGLIKYGLPEDCWFHVDDLSSAHVYLRLQPGEALDDIPTDALLDCATLVKANSIVGCKKTSVYIVYTRWKNLKKTNDMVDGQVGFHRPENVRRIQVEKNNFIVNALNKTKVEKFPDLAALQQDRIREMQQEKKQHRREEEKAKKALDLEAKRAKEEFSYDRIMTSDNMTRNSEFEATADSTAAEEYEDDFF
uniref:NFACT RNA-binding domain-containing protein n=1 Tax=Attheya septentrionalis TaxID=420275 RepID=A0A6T7JWY1_9STRA|mmetsp:Transcript_7159/g.12842  ORF Transcript_7159/g.12842 Transcript_7159/m.12842 type:complete len:215 (+) Transcript_7159:121-765(+)